MNKNYIISLIAGMLIMLQSTLCNAHSGYIINTTDSDMEFQIITNYWDGDLAFEYANAIGVASEKNKDSLYRPKDYHIPAHSSAFYNNKAAGPRNIRIRSSHIEKRTEQQTFTQRPSLGGLIGGTITEMNKPTAKQSPTKHPQTNDAFNNTTTVIDITYEDKKLDPIFYESKQWGGDYIIYKDGDKYGVSKR